MCLFPYVFVIALCASVAESDPALVILLRYLKPPCLADITVLSLALPAPFIQFFHKCPEAVLWVCCRSLYSMLSSWAAAIAACLKHRVAPESSTCVCNSYFHIYILKRCKILLKDTLFALNLQILRAFSWTGLGLDHICLHVLTIVFAWLDFLRQHIPRRALYQGEPWTACKCWCLKLATSMVDSFLLLLLSHDTPILSLSGVSW